MSFASGSVSFRRFVVVGKAPKTVEQKILDKLDERLITGEISEQKHSELHERLQKRLDELG